MSVIAWLFGLLSIWWVWLPIVAFLLYLTFQNHRRLKQIDALEHVVLLLEVPRSNDKQAVAAEQLFAGLHGLLRSKKELVASGEVQEHLGFEIVAADKTIQFYLWVPKHLQQFVEGQLYTNYPAVQIREVAEDYATHTLKEGQTFHSVEIGLARNVALPIKTYESFESDALSALATALGKLEYSTEEYWVQILTRPIDESWQRKAAAFTTRLKNGQKGIEVGGILRILLQLAQAFWRAPQPASTDTHIQLSDQERTRVEACDKKQSKPGFQVKIRLCYVGTDERTAALRLQALLSAFKQFGTSQLNDFTAKATKDSSEALAAYRARFFIDKGFVLNTEELATLFHLPYDEMATASIAWAKSKTTEPPTELPALTGEQSHDTEISAFASTNFRGVNQQFGLYRNDRDRHAYIIGQTGVGKSKLLELFALSDLYQNQGYAIIDPHGDFAINNLYFVPPSRAQDVVYFNLADSDFPIGFNPMEITNPAFKGRVSTEMVSVLRHVFSADWNSRLEYMLRYIMLALLEHESATMLDITRMLTDSEFRNHVLDKVTDPVVLSFWRDDFPQWKDTFANEAISPILNKIGAFTSHPIIRNIIGQPKSSFNLRQLMDEGKIFVVNLSGSLLGEDNAALLGSLLITKIQQAAMSRTDPTHRRPFYLYVDEFQNFATDSFVPILSEARKYGLSLTMANQYVAQMSPMVRDAVFGNVGAMITFRISADDAAILGKYYEPRFEPADLTQLHNRHFAISMSIRGEKTPAFSGTTLALPQVQQNYLAEIIASSRSRFCLPKHEVIQLLVKQAIIPEKPSAHAIRTMGAKAQHLLTAQPHAAAVLEDASDEYEVRIRH